MRSPLAIALLFTLLLVGWLASGPIQRLAGDPPPRRPRSPSAEPAARRMTVRVVESAAQPIAPEIVVNGHTAPVRAVELKAETSGRVVELPVAEGSRGRRPARCWRGSICATARHGARRWRRPWPQRRARVRGRPQARRQGVPVGDRAWPRRWRSSRQAQAALRRRPRSISRTPTIAAPFSRRARAAAGRGRRFRRGRRPGGDGDRAGPVPGRGRRRRRAMVGAASRSACRARPSWPTAARSTGRIRYVATAGRRRPPGPSGSSWRCPTPSGRLPAGMSAGIRRAASRVPAHRVSAALLVAGRRRRDRHQGGRRRRTSVRFHPARDRPRRGRCGLARPACPSGCALITVGQGFVAAGEQVGVPRWRRPSPRPRR